MSLFSDIGKIAKAVVKSPITKVVAGAATIVFPPAGAAMVAGLAAANVAVDLADSASPKAPEAKAILQATVAAGGPPAAAVQAVQAAKQGDPQAAAQVRTMVNQGVAQMSADPSAAGAANQIKNVVANASYKKALSLNAIILAFNSKDPKKRAAVAREVQALRRSRRPQDRAKLRTLRRRTAAIKKARTFFVDSRGLVKRKQDVKIGADKASAPAKHPPLPQLRRLFGSGKPRYFMRNVITLPKFRIGEDIAPHAVTWWVELVRPLDPENAPYWRLPFRASGFDALRRPANIRNWLFRWTGSRWAKVA